MIAVPSEQAITKPELYTSATDGSDELHTTALLVALAGVIVAINVSFLLTTSERVFLLSFTDVTDISPDFTVTVQIAVLLPSSVVTVIVAVPSFKAPTKPLWSTSAPIL